MKKEMKVHKEHKSKAPKEINFALVVVSTSRYQELKSNKETTITLLSTEIIPDSEEHLNIILTKIMKDEAVDAIIFSGGTGLTLKDITFETIEPRLEKIFSGFGEIFRNLSYNEIGSAAMLSRAMAGILRSKQKSKVVFLLPGSPKAVKLALNALILPEIGHILYMINKKE